MKKIISFLSLIAILAGIFLTIEAIRKPAPEITPETSYAVSRKDIAETLKIKGDVKSSEIQALDLSFDSAGKIDDILVREGDSIKSGDVLAIISTDSQSLVQQKNAAKKALDQAQANLTQAIASPKTQEVKYWDQSVVDEAQNYLNQVRAGAESNIALAQNQVNFYQNELNKITDQINQAKNNPDNISIIKASIKADLIRAYSSLDKNIWLHDRIQVAYFNKSDQIGFNVKEKEADAFTKYYTVKWYMDNQIHNVDNPADWAIADCLEQMKQAFEKLEIAYQTIIEAFKDPLYIDRLTVNDREDIEEARKDVNKNLALIVESQAKWLNRNTNIDNTLLQQLENQKTNLTTSLASATNYLNQIKAQGQTAINQATANLNNAYIKALKTKTITLQNDTTSLEAALRQAQEKYNQLLAQNPLTTKLIAKTKGTIAQILAAKGTLVKANQTIIKINQAGGLQIEINTDNKNINLFEEVLITSEKYPAQSWQGMITDLFDNKALVSFSNCPLEDTTCSATLASGDTVNLEIKLLEKKNALTIPLDYLVKQDDKTFVNMMKDGKMALQEIRTGIVNHQYVEVLEGLNEGDTIYLPNNK